jgi:hypothetical protein
MSDGPSTGHLDGKRDMELSVSANQELMQCKATLRVSSNITQRDLFRKSSWCFFRKIILPWTRDISGASVLRPLGAVSSSAPSHGLRRGLYSFATSWLTRSHPPRLQHRIQILRMNRPNDRILPAQVPLHDQLRQRLLQRKGPILPRDGDLLMQMLQ